tara:strand:+ start:354 stop:524 length:171 start_codon:yes stop_codon:yes gene_type:complete
MTYQVNLPINVISEIMDHSAVDVSDETLATILDLDYKFGNWFPTTSTNQSVTIFVE